jgi:hypothetical protein
MGSGIVYYLVQSPHFDGYICTDGVDDDSGEEIICKDSSRCHQDHGHGNALWVRSARLDNSGREPTTHRLKTMDTRVYNRYSLYFFIYV